MSSREQSVMGLESRAVSVWILVPKHFVTFFSKTFNKMIYLLRVHPDFSIHQSTGN